MKGKIFLKSVFSRPIAFHPALAKMTGSITAGLMLSQAIYWSDTLEDEREGWFHKTQDDWTKETCLTRYEQESARKTLRNMKLLIEERRGLNPVLWFRVDFEVLLTLWNQSDAEKPHQAVLETSIRQGGKLASGGAGNQQQVEGKTSSAYKEAETTTEITTESKAGSSFPQDVQNQPKARLQPEDQTQKQSRKAALSQSERDSWDLRRFQGHMADSEVQPGTYIPDKAAHWVNRAKQAAYLAGVSMPRLIELLRPFFTSEDDRRYVELLERELNPQRELVELSTAGR